MTYINKYIFLTQIWFQVIFFCMCREFLIEFVIPNLSQIYSLKRSFLVNKIFCFLEMLIPADLTVHIGLSSINVTFSSHDDGKLLNLMMI